MVTPFSEPVLGGITTFVRSLSTELARLGADVLVLSRQGTSHAGVQVLGGDSRTFSHRASKAIRKFEPDAIHAHAHWYAARAAIVARETESKVVFSFHTHWTTTGRVRNRILRRLEVRVVYPGSEIRTVDSEARDRLRDEFLRRKCNKFIGYVGQLHWREKAQGLGLLLEALSKPSLAETGVAVAGGGSFLHDMKAYADRLGVSGRVLFLGEIPNPGFVYAGCDVYCHASLQEGMGLAVLEAMRLGCAIVGFRADFMREAITDKSEGLLVDPDADSLASALSLVLSDPVLASRLGGAARRKAEAKFDWTEAARTFLGLYGVDA